MRRAISIALMAVGVVACGLGIASATVWRMSNTLTATHTLAADSAAAIADPGVMEVAANKVTIRVVSTHEAPVVLAVGRDTDVAGWVGDAPVEHLTGLGKDRTSLATTTVKGTGTLPKAAGSDLWVVQEAGNGSATLSWERQAGRWSLLVSPERTSGGAGETVKVEMTWPQDVTTPYLYPLVGAGGGLIVVGLVLAFVDMRARRHAVVAKSAARPDTEAVDEPVAARGQLARSKGVKVSPQPSRRQAAHAGGLIDGPESEPDRGHSGAALPPFADAGTSAADVPAAGHSGHDAYRPGGEGAAGGPSPERSTLAERMRDSVRAVDLGETEGTSEITMTRRQLREAERTKGRGARPAVPTAPLAPSASTSRPTPGVTSPGQLGSAHDEPEGTGADDAMLASPYTQPVGTTVDMAADRWRRVWSVIPTVPGREEPTAQADGADEEGKKK